MTEKTLDVIGIGNAIVDVMAYVQDSFIDAHGLTKGTMALVDEKRVEVLYKAMGTCAECSGGSVANTMAGIASLGGTGAFIGKVAEDAFGNIFRHDMRSEGLNFDSKPVPAGKLGTARSLIAVTPDAQRTMNTYLGVAPQIHPAEIDEKIIASAKILYVEGYLWDREETKSAIIKAAGIAGENGTKVAFSLSDLFCVERHRTEFLELMDEHLDIVFANEQEAQALFETKDIKEIATRFQSACDIAAITMSEKGSVIVSGEERHEVPAETVEDVADTTGAGDMYAAGFLYGLTHGMNLADAGNLGSRCAADIIKHLGARPMKPLKRFL